MKDVKLRYLIKFDFTLICLLPQPVRICILPKTNFFSSKKLNIVTGLDY